MHMLRKALLPSLAVFACACAFVVQSPGWAQTSYMALGKALWHGTAQIDEWHWESHDIAWSDGHYYSVKPPGLVLVVHPANSCPHASRVLPVYVHLNGLAVWL